MSEKTDHRVIFGNARNLDGIEDESIALVVTSPPYPMIEMWDESFSSQDRGISRALRSEKPQDAFELMHQTLDEVWGECHRVLCEGGIACINIGDATRTINSQFQLFPNHARIISAMLRLGFSNLPNIIWHKQTNAPNKFMGSGMLAPGAYVTLEHEFILIFRKGNKRDFSSSEKVRRRESAYFWEERNQWFSDLWQLKGTTQSLVKNGARSRSGAYPFEIPYRLINMFSVKGDTILDPFLGMGTTSLAAAASGRNSVGYELESDFGPIIREMILSENSLSLANDVIRRRILNHQNFVDQRVEEKGEEGVKHFNDWFDLPVITRQEREMVLQFVVALCEREANLYEAAYTQEALLDYQGEGSLFSHI